jgi:hypothetical protein
MPSKFIYAIATIAAFVLGGGLLLIWIVVSDGRERRKHYKLTLTVTPDGSLGVYKSKLTEMNRDALTIVPFKDDQIADIDIRLSDGKAVVFDLRPKG